MTEWSYQMFVFFVAHLIAMSSSVYNPFVYAWFNDTFRAQFRHVLSCCRRRSAAGRCAGDRRCGVDVDASPSRFATVGGGCGWSSTDSTNRPALSSSLDRRQPLPARTEPPPIELAELGSAEVR